MVIQDSFTFAKPKQNFERDCFATIAEMKGYSERKLPTIFHAMCEETGKLYLFNKANEVDPILGKWREQSSSSSSGSGLTDEQLSHLMFQFAVLPTESSDAFPIVNGMKAFNLSDGKVYQASVDSEGNITWNEVKKVELSDIEVTIDPATGAVTVNNSNDSEATVMYSLNGGEYTDTLPEIQYGDTLSVIVTQNGISTEPVTVTRSIPTPTITIDETTGGISITNGSVGGITYHYTTDGSTPTADSPIYYPYNPPIEFENGQNTIKIVGITDSGATSEVISATYEVPKPTVTVNPDTGEVVVSSTSTNDDVVIKYSINGGEELVYDSSNPPSLEDGQTITIKVYTNGLASEEVSSTYEVPRHGYVGFINNMENGEFPIAEGGNFDPTGLEVIPNIDTIGRTLNYTSTQAEVDTYNSDEGQAFEVYAYPASLGRLTGGKDPMFDTDFRDIENYFECVNAKLNNIDYLVYFLPVNFPRVDISVSCIVQ